jgi:hypothetical protein
MKTYNERVKLVVHVALDPNDFRQSKKQANMPRGEREQYWRESFAEAGINDLKPLIPHLWLVSVAQIHQEAVLRYITSKEARRRIDGGVSLMHRDEMIAPSMCCADFGNLESWRHAAAYRESKWLMLWNGHPWMYMRYERDHLLFTDLMEDEPRSRHDVKYAIPVSVLQQAVGQASEDLKLFEARCAPYMEDR